MRGRKPIFIEIFRTEPDWHKDGGRECDLLLALDRIITITDQGENVSIVGYINSAGESAMAYAATSDLKPVIWIAPDPYDPG